MIPRGEVAPPGGPLSPRVDRGSSEKETTPRGTTLIAGAAPAPFSCDPWPCSLQRGLSVSSSFRSRAPLDLAPSPSHAYSPSSDLTTPPLLPSPRPELRSTAMAGAAGRFITRAFEAMLKECAANRGKFAALQQSIQSYLGACVRPLSSLSSRALGSRGG